MKESIPSNVTEWLAITVRQKHNEGCGFAEIEKLRLVIVLLLAGTHEKAHFNGMFLLCCSIMYSHFRMVTQLP